MPIPEGLQIDERWDRLTLEEMIATSRAVGDRVTLDKALAMRGMLRVRTKWTDMQIDNIQVGDVAEIMEAIHAAEEEERDEAVPPTSSEPSPSGPAE